MTECNQRAFPFEAHFSRQVVAGFAGARMTTDSGALRLCAVDRKIDLLKRVAACFTPERVEHALPELLAQRIYALTLGYEDLNDHEELLRDPLLALLACKREIAEPLAGKSTLNRLELSRANEAPHQRYHKISYSGQAIDALLVEIFLEAPAKPPQEIVLRSGRYRYAAARPARSSFLSWLLWALLLSATVHFLRRPSLVVPLAAIEKSLA